MDKPEMVLARCINPAMSENALMMGEYYLIRFFNRVDLPGTPLHQANIMAYHVPDGDLKDENFMIYLSTKLYIPVEAYEQKVRSGNPTYVGPRVRFEILCRPEQVVAAYHMARERQAYVTGSYKGPKP